MVTRADITGTRPVATIEPPTPVVASASAKQEIFNRLVQIEIGRQLQAEVLSRFDDGTFLVKVDDTPARMHLPDGAKVGDMLWMTKLTNTPRPAFLLGTEAGSTPTTLSSAGRLIDTVLNVAQQTDTDTAVTGKTPLLPSSAILAAPDAPQQVATAMQKTLETSGLFYESHLQKWVDGGRTTQQVMQEARANTAHAGNALQLQQDAGTSLPALTAQIREAIANGQSLQDVLKAWQVQIRNAASTDADIVSPSIQPETLHAESVQLINQQLHVLEQRQFAWRGELFPGLPIDWEVSEDRSKNEGNHENAEKESAWQSTVRVDLPVLGAVTATIHLANGRVRIDIHTARDAAVTSLRAHSSELSDALQAAGSPLDAFSVKQHAKTG